MQITELAMKINSARLIQETGKAMKMQLIPIPVEILEHLIEAASDGLNQRLSGLPRNPFCDHKWEDLFYRVIKEHRCGSCGTVISYGITREEEHALQSSQSA